MIFHTYIHTSIHTYIHTYIQTHIITFVNASFIRNNTQFIQEIKLVDPSKLRVQSLVVGWPQSKDTTIKVRLYARVFMVTLVDE